VTEPKWRYLNCYDNYGEVVQFLMQPNSEGKEVILEGRRESEAVAFASHLQYGISQRPWTLDPWKRQRPLRWERAIN